MMKKPSCLTLTALRSLSWIFVAVLTASSAWAIDGNAPSDSGKATYEATCSFIVDEIKRLDIIVGKAVGRDELVREDRESGASLYRHQGEDIRIDYIVVSGGKTIISRAELGPMYIGERLTAKSLKNKLRITHDLPQTLQTGCDRYDLTVKKKGSQITAMTINADVD